MLLTTLLIFIVLILGPLTPRIAKSIGKFVDVTIYYADGRFRGDDVQRNTHRGRFVSSGRAVRVGGAPHLLFSIKKLRTLYYDELNNR